MASTRSFARLAPGHHIAIIGAGPAGLTIGYLLAKRGYQVTVCEGTDMVGGISQTARYKGYRFDIGGHRFFTKIAPVQALWEELLGDDFIDVPRLSRIHYSGKYFNYPLKAMNALMGLGPIEAVRIMLSYFHAKMYPSPVEETFEQWVSNRFGTRLYEIFFKTYTEKVWGIPCTEIRAEWAAQRIQGLSLARAILNATALNRRNNSIKSLIESFKYPRFGPGQMWEKAAERIEELGGRVLMKHWVHQVELQDGKAKAIVAKSPLGDVRIKADHVISTTDVRALVRCFGDQAPPEARTAAEGLRYRDFLTVALMLDKTDMFPDNWIYVHTPGVKVGRIQNFNNWSAAMVEPGRTCLGLEYFCFEGDGLWTTSDADLVALAGKELAQLGLATPDSVVDGCVVRMPKAYPIYDAEYREHLDGVRAFIDPISNLHTVGRNGMHKYNNQDHSMYTAMLTLENMLGEAQHDVWAVNTDFEYHEEQKIETANAGTAKEAAA
ncbi:MAG: NAD(P)/FAD-dependent oxidoreductase [Gemmatimonadetes bacterium]|nr:NAD(P)/FAD-dependent oxidoreductase [Gemmatimonadota bacterium]